MSERRKPRIVVAGSANIDLLTYTDEYPRPGETIFGRAFDLGFGGKGANQAVAARLCGADVAMVARVGDDMFGEATVANFERFGIDTSYVHITEGISTGVAPIFVDSTGQNRILVVKGANDRLTPADIDAAAGLIAEANCLVVQLEIPLETTWRALRLARSCGVRTILNPAPSQPIDFAEAANADYFIPNESEAEALSGLPVRNVAEAEICARQLVDRGLRRVILTLGANGSLLAAPGDSKHVAPFAVEARDSTGAGDAFIGSLACFLAEGLDDETAARRSNLYAALSTLGAGTQKSFPDRETFENQAGMLSRQTV